MRRGRRAGIRAVVVTWAVVSTLCAFPRAASGAGVVGTGSSETCTEAAFVTVLTGGGLVTFDCGPSDHTIVLTTPLVIGADTTIDGADRIIFSGGGAVRPFAVGPGITLVLDDVVIRDGVTADDGGCLHNAGTLVLADTTVESCAAARDGGGVFNDVGGTLDVLGSLVRSNQATRHGGGIYDGGASAVIGATTITSNDAGGDGGGVYGTGALTVTSASLVTLNDAQRGGGVYVVSGTAGIASTTVSGNRAMAAGSGVYNASGATLDVTGGEIRNNANASGGTVTGAGLYNEGIASVSGTTLRTNSGVQGGAIYHTAGTLTLTACTVSSNIASTGGGAVLAAPATLTNCTLSGNLGGNGAAIYSTSAVMLQNVTVADNRGQSNPLGTALFRAAGTLTLRNALVALNSPFDCGGVMTSAGNNLSGDTSCVLTGPGDLDNVDAQVGSLQNNGGPTRTHLPWGGSLAIDAGMTVECPATDQRGVVRPIGSTCDIGAVERQATDATSTTSTSSSSSTSTTSSTSTSTSIPSTTSTSLPWTTSTSVPPTTSTSVPPTTSTSVPPTTSTSLPPTTSTTVPLTTSTSIPPASTTTSTTTSSSSSSSSSTSVTSATSMSSTTETSTTTATSTITSTSTPVVEVCGNGTDDDGDDLADCRDPDCAMDPACPAACGEDTEFRVLACRIEALTVRTEAVAAAEPFASDATGVLSKASASAGSAEVACDDGNRGRARRGLRRLGESSAKYGKRVHSKIGRQAIPEASMRDDLSSAARRIRHLAKRLRRVVICPPAL